MVSSVKNSTFVNSSANFASSSLHHPSHKAGSFKKELQKTGASPHATTVSFSPPQIHSSPQNQKLWEEAKGLEANFLASIVKDMVHSPEIDEFYQGSSQENLLAPELAKAYATQIVEQGGTGLALDIYRQATQSKK